VIIVVVRQQKNTAAAAASLAADRWKSDLDALMRSIGPCFRRIESRMRARALVGALMMHLERRNCWTLAEEAGEPNPCRFQHLLSRAKWDGARVRSVLRGHVAESLGGDDLRVRVVDETGDVKKGRQTVGVQRQYSGTAADRER
jgi:SRSO17 transposase